MEKMIRVLLFTYGREVPNPFYVEGGDQPQTVVAEGLARLGEVVDVTREYDLERGERLGAFFSDEERTAIENGTYRGVDAPSVVQARLSAVRSEGIQPAEGEGPTPGDIAGMDASEVADMIREQKLNVQETIALVGENPTPNELEKLLDAEGIASQGEPRSGVTRAIEARLAEATTG